MLITSRSSATCCAGALLYESTAITYCPNRLAAITNSLPSSPEPRRRILFCMIVAKGRKLIGFEAKTFLAKKMKTSGNKIDSFCFNKQSTLFHVLLIHHGTDYTTS